MEGEERGREGRGWEGWERKKGRGEKDVLDLKVEKVATLSATLIKTKGTWHRRFGW